jgi:hypothetical protein
MGRKKDLPARMGLRQVRWVVGIFPIGFITTLASRIFALADVSVLSHFMLWRYAFGG